MRNWERPMVVVDTFAANEFVSTCGDENKEYLFTCDAGGGKSGYVYLETNDKPGLQTDDGWGYRADKYLSGYHACGAIHNAKNTDEFLEGYYVRHGNVTNVIVWRGPKGDNTHCTTNLSMNTWPTAKS